MTEDMELTIILIVIIVGFYVGLGLFWFILLKMQKNEKRKKLDREKLDREKLDREKLKIINKLDSLKREIKNKPIDEIEGLKFCYINCPECVSKICAGAKICPFCHSKLDSEYNIQDIYKKCLKLNIDYIKDLKSKVDQVDSIEEVNEFCCGVYNFIIPPHKI